MNDQLQLHIPERSADEIIREKLEDACQRANEADIRGDRVERLLALDEVKRLRALLKGER